MKRTTGWLLAGFGVGFGVVAALALLLALPRTRRMLAELGDKWLERVGDAVREGVRAARIREAELESVLVNEELGLDEGGPDYVV